MNNIYKTLLVLIAVIIIGVAWYIFDGRADRPQTTNNSDSSSLQTLQIKSMNQITIKTNKGDIVFETYDIDAPKTVANFISLANKGYYNGLIFHRVIKGFMIQGGDPTGTGSGGPGYKFADELDPNTSSAKLGYVRGTVAMANAGPDTNGSQFFIMHKDTPLPHNYTIFGRIVSGMEVVDAIAGAPVGPNDRPIEKMIMEKVTVAVK
jgi:cyclophilin family peptidyl-prolyl cis-trans isomerase